MRKTADELGLRLEARSRVLVAVVAGILFLAAVTGAITVGGGDDRASPTTSTTSTTSVFAVSNGPTRFVDGFTSIAFRLTSGSRTESHCGLIADSADKRSKGLMDQPDLAGYDAMIFQFPELGTPAFYMANVDFPLSIAWFDDQGRFVGSTDMPICEVSAADCPTYTAAAPYKYALEVEEGELDDLGAVNGSTLQMGNVCS